MKRNDLKCALCGRYMLWVQDTLLCPKCDLEIIYEINPNTICQNYVKRYKNGKNKKRKILHF